jgi:hypothetical protein
MNKLLLTTLLCGCCLCGQVLAQSGDSNPSAGQDAMENTAMKGVGKLAGKLLVKTAGNFISELPVCDLAEGSYKIAVQGEYKAGGDQIVSGTMGSIAGWAYGSMLYTVVGVELGPAMLAGVVVGYGTKCLYLWILAPKDPIPGVANDVAHQAGGPKTPITVRPPCAPSGGCPGGCK